MDTESGTESAQAAAEQTVAPSEGTQPGNDTTIPTSAPETRSSEPTVPLSRLNEVIRERNELRARAQAQAPVEKPAVNAPKQEEFQTYEEFVRADATHHAREAAKEEFKNLQQQQQQGYKAYQEQERSSNAYNNWAKQMTELAAKDPTVSQLRPDVLGNMPTELTLMVMESKAAGPLTAHLLRNPEEIFRLGSMNPYQAAMEIGEMSAKLAGPTGQPPKKPSGSIPNLEPVGQGKGPGNKSPNDYSQDDVTKRLYPL